MANIQVSPAEITRFIEALDSEGLAGITEADAAATDATITDLIAKWGQADNEVDADNGLTIYCWDRLQTAKGKARGDLVAVAIAGGSLSYFSGEV